jgi:hypothetical protein
MVKSQAGPTGGDIGEGQVESIQNVNIEMHDEFSMRRARQRTPISGDLVGDHGTCTGSCLTRHGHTLDSNTRALVICA